MSKDEANVGATGAVHGVAAEGMADVGALKPLGRSGLHHWWQSKITQPGLEDRGSVFFAAVEITRMPMILVEPSPAWSHVVVIDTLEALLIESLEPPLNRRRGDNLAAAEYLQVADPEIKRRKKLQMAGELLRAAGMTDGAEAH